MAILENGRYGNQDANLQWPNIQISSKYIKLCVYQIWCLYHKMNNMLAVPPHYSANSWQRNWLAVLLHDPEECVRERVEIYII